MRSTPDGACSQDAGVAEATAIAWHGCSPPTQQLTPAI